MRFFHFAHLKRIDVKNGQLVKRGTPIGLVGKSGLPQNQPNAHLHYEVWKVDPAITKYVGYTYGMIKKQVLERYEAPYPFIDVKDAIPAPYTSNGFGFLSVIDNKGTLHPGIDINSQGGGDADIGQIVRSSSEGIVVFTGNNTGWGNHIFIKESLTPTLMNQAKVVKSKTNATIWVCYPVPDMAYLNSKVALEDIDPKIISPDEL